MAQSSSRRLRRSAAQLHALASVERTISAADTVSRCRYLKDYSSAFRSYRHVLPAGDLDRELLEADVILVGDYHALAASQGYAADILQRLTRTSDRPVLFCLEAVVARDQKALDLWFRGEVDSEELREQIRFDQDWGYDWAPYRTLLETARKLSIGVYGLDCRPRSDMRTIARRDRHAAARIAELRRAHPEARIVVLFGESHLAPNHLPGLLREQRPEDRVLTVLQNVDALYWQAAGEPGEQVEAVHVDDGVVCAFNSSPLEKYENYRLYIERWRREHPNAPNLAPSFYNLIDTLARFLKVGMLIAGEHPEVSNATGTREILRRLRTAGLSRVDIAKIRAAVRLRGSYYVPEARTLFAKRFLMPEAAEEAARFVHHACQTESENEAEIEEEDRFYQGVIEQALAYLGSKVLCPARVVTCVADARVRLGQMLASRIYDAYVAGTVSKRFLRSLFCAPIRQAGEARELYFGLVAQFRCHPVEVGARASQQSQMVI